MNVHLHLQFERKENSDHCIVYWWSLKIVFVVSLPINYHAIIFNYSDLLFK